MCRIFNDLEPRQRKPFHAIVVRGESIAAHAARTGVSESDVNDVLREVFTILATLGADEEGGVP
jgi:DNA-directed RNA polymerase specialized sigma24 family protein